MRVTTIKEKLLGCLEIALFMQRGSNRFSGDLGSMKKSFLIPVILLPLTIAMILGAHPVDSLDATSAQMLIAIYALRLVIYLAGFLALVYAFAAKLDRMDDFYKFVTANNWLTIPAAALTAPLIIMFLNGYYSWAEIYPLVVVIALYSYGYTAFMAAQILRIPYELACFIAIAGMAIHQTSLAVLKWAAVNTLMVIS